MAELLSPGLAFVVTISRTALIFLPSSISFKMTHKPSPIDGSVMAGKTNKHRIIKKNIVLFELRRIEVYRSFLKPCQP